MERSKSFWFLGLFILLIAAASSLFFKINFSTDERNLISDNKQNLINFDRLNSKNFSFLKKINNDIEDERGLINEEISTTETKEEKFLSLLFVGDLMLDRHVAERLKNKDLSFLLTDFSPKVDFWQQYDLVGANLEGAVTNQGEHYAPVNLYDFAFSPERIVELKNFNFSYFALANNHFNDQGKKGVSETRENLSNLGFYYSGTIDAKIDEYSRVDLVLKDLKVALISLSMVYNNFSLLEAEEIITDAALENDLVIINIHWGNEYEHYFNRYQQERARALIEAGADIIIGHHPHVVQGMEIYNNRPIFYSLGNFIFDQYFSSDTQEGLALELQYQNNQLQVNFLPFNSHLSTPKLLTESEREEFLSKFITWSKLDEELKVQLKEGYINLNFN